MDLPFDNPGLLQQSLVHRSYLNENPDFSYSSNERLEFMGDAVLGFVVTEEIFGRFPERSEGELTHVRAAIVRGATLARWAKRLGLGERLLLSRGEEANGGRQRPANLANAMEAVLGALYLEQGLDAVRALVLPLRDWDSSWRPDLGSFSRPWGQWRAISSSKRGSTRARTASSPCSR